MVAVTRVKKFTASTGKRCLISVEKLNPTRSTCVNLPPPLSKCGSVSGRNKKKFWTENFSKNIIPLSFYKIASWPLVTLFRIHAVEATSKRRASGRSHHSRHHETSRQLGVRQNRDKRRTPSHRLLLKRRSSCPGYKQSSIHAARPNIGICVPDDQFQKYHSIWYPNTNWIFCLQLCWIADASVLLRIFFLRRTPPVSVVWDGRGFLAFGKSLDDCVSPGKLEHYFRNRSVWFPSVCCYAHVQDYETCRLAGSEWVASEPCYFAPARHDKRTPSLFKVEWEGDGFIDLCSKFKFSTEVLNKTHTKISEDVLHGSVTKQKKRCWKKPWFSV